MSSDAGTPRVSSVHRGRVREYAWAGRSGRTGIVKAATAEPVRITAAGLEGDEVADTAHHGGSLKAVYAVSRSELDHWQRELGGPLRDGLFGENLTLTGIDVDDAVVGEQWRVGDAVLEVSWPRIPCRTFAGWIDALGFDARGWVKRFTAHARPGTYLSVRTPGTVRAGDPVEVLARPAHGVTVSALFRAATLEPDRVAGLPEELAERVARQR